MSCQRFDAITFYFLRPMYCTVDVCKTVNANNANISLCNLNRYTEMCGRYC